MPVRQGKTQSAVLAANGKHIAIGSAWKTTRRIEVWDVEHYRSEGDAAAPEISLPLESDDDIWALDFNPDGEHLAAAGGDMTRVVEFATGVVTNRFARHDAVTVANVSPNGDRVVTGGSDGCAKIWDRSTQRVVRRLEVPGSGRVNDAVFSPDSTSVLIATDDGKARLWKLTPDDAEKAFGEFIGHGARVRSAGFSPNGKYVVTASEDKTARIWNAETLKEEYCLKGHDQAVLCAAFSGDEQWVVTGSDDNSALIWRVPRNEPGETGHPSKELRPTARCEGHTASVVAAAFGSGGRRVITGSKDRTARIWDATNGTEVLVLKGHSRELTSASFSPDDKKALTSSRDGIAIVWDADEWK